MKQIFGRLFTLAVVAAGTGVVAPACVQDDQSIYVRFEMAPPANRQNGQCIYTNDPTSPENPEGALDVAATDHYTATLLVGNQMNQRGDQSNTRAEPNRAHLNGAVVSVTLADGTEIGSFTATGTGFADPQQGTTGSFGIVQVTAIDAATSAKLSGMLGPFDPASRDQALNDKLVIANIRVFGTTLGGVDLETGTFQFPIRVCKGCLITFGGGDDAATPGLDCNLPLTSGGGSTTITLPCTKGQDEATPCQVCQDHPACRGKAIP